MSQADDFDELAALLPFYVNGSLDAEQRARIDAALTTMPALRAELLEVQAIHARVKISGARMVGSDVLAPTERLRNLQARIAAAEAAEKPPADGSADMPTNPLSDTASRISAAKPASIQQASVQLVPSAPAHAHFGARQPRFRPSWSMALAAGLAAVSLIQGVMLYRLQSGDERGGEYTSLSGPTDVAGRSGPRFAVRFQADTRWSDVQALCERLNLRIVRGPEEGMIDLAPSAELDDKQIDAIEMALKQSPSVVFVGRQR
jgi:anti-sigma factor RsiW